MRLYLYSMKYISSTSFRLFLSVGLTFLSLACSHTQVASSEPSPASTTSKKLAILPFEVSNDHKPGGPKDTLCTCIAKDIEAAFIPYLQRAGFQVVALQPSAKLNDFQLNAWADSVQVDYIFSGKATVSLVGSSRFMHRLNVQVVRTQDRSVLASASQEAVSVEVNKAVSKVGKALEAKLKP